MASLDWFPREAAPLNELVYALQASANEFIAAYVVEEWLREQTAAPKPAELRRMVWVENEKRDDELRRNKPKCPICKGVGMILVTGGFSKLDGRQYTGAKDCECRREAIERDRAAHAK